MRLADAPVKRMFSGRIAQKHSLFWWLPGYPDTIQVNQPARFAPSFLSDLIAPDRIALDRVNSIDSGAHPVFSRELPAGPTVSARVGLIGDLRQGLAIVVGLKRLGLAR